MKEGLWREMGLKDAEYELIQSILGRDPNYVELGMYSVMWSEHCSYKNSRQVLKTLPTTGERVLQGPGENAGIIDIGDGLAIVFKVESHNHPSAIEPYQGAATGVGGIIRDIFTMGARPIALLNSLRFGPLEDARVRYLMEEVVSGIAGYGNCIGIPTVGGEIFFDESYRGNPLVNVMCVGIIEKDKIALGKAAGIGNAVILVGARTGRDGMHGVTFASEELGEASEERRPAVQVGDPFMEKLLLEACLELIDKKIIIGIQDLGGAGLTCATCEMASRAGTGMEVEINQVPTREEGMTPYEIMLSESQERMLLVVEKEKEGEVERVFTKWGLTSSTIGRVTADGQLKITKDGELVVNIPAESLAEGAPVCYPEMKKPAYLKEARVFGGLESLAKISHEEAFYKLLDSPNIASKEWIYRQYDYMVRTSTVLSPGADAAVLRIRGGKKGIAMTVDCNARYTYLDPYSGGALAVAEAARNLACTGAKPLAVTDCLNFGSPEKPEIYWQFTQAAAGIKDACLAFDTPVTGGNVSFYNETDGAAVFPTPVLGMIGLIEDIENIVTPCFKEAGNYLILAGSGRPSLEASEYLKAIYGQTKGTPPTPDLPGEKKIQEVLLSLVEHKLLASAHDLTEGGLVMTLAESALAGGLGAEVDLPAGEETTAFLFGEGAPLVLLSVSENNLSEVRKILQQAAVPFQQAGRVLSSSRLVVKNEQETFLDLDMQVVAKKWREAIPLLMGE